MIDELTAIQGYFSTPSVPGVHCCGSLEYSPTRGVRLELLGHLGSKDYYPRGDRNLKIIHGKLENGKNVTLFDCDGTESFRTPGLGKSRFSVRLLAYGVSVPDISSLAVKTGVCRFVNQEDWIDRRGLTASSSNEDYPKYKVSFKQPKTIVVSEVDRFKLLIWFSYSIPIGRKLRSIDQSFKAKSYFNFEYKTSATVDQFLDDVRTLEHFLGLVTGLSTPLEFCSITTVNHPKHWEGYQLFYYHHPEQPVQRTLYDEDFLWTFKDLRSSIARLYSNWSVLHEKVRTTLDLYYDHRYNTSTYETNKFIYYSFAFESLHRRLNSGYKKFPQREYKNMCARLVKESPRKYKKHVESALGNRNELSLGERYMSVFSDLRGSSQFFDPEKVERYLKKIVRSRNHMAHNGTLGDGSEKFITPDNVWMYNLLIQLLITYMLLKAIGLSKKRLVKALTIPRAFSFLGERDGL
jgi:hypothetical protein